MTREVVLMGGGIDSACLLAERVCYAALARHDSEIYPLMFDIGQPNAKEEYIANTKVVTQLRHQHAACGLFPQVTIRTLYCVQAPGVFQALRVASGDVGVPVDAGLAQAGDSIQVPGRNAVFCLLANAFAHRHECSAIFTASHGPFTSDSAMPNMGDNSSDFYCTMNTLLGYCTPGTIGSTRDAVRVVGLYTNNTKAHVVWSGFDAFERINARARQKGEGCAVFDSQVLYESYTCNVGNEVHCGRCYPCMLRKRAFADAGIPDLTLYADEHLESN